MSYENFKPTIWSKHIEQELSKLTVMQEDCNTNFQGEVGPGKTVKIIGAARPTVNTYVPGQNIASAETPADTSIYLAVDQYRYTHFLVDDIDAAQSVDGMMQAYMKGSSEELAEIRDRYLAELAARNGHAGVSTAIDTDNAAKAAIDAAFTWLWNNGVKIGDDVSVVLTPWFYSKFKNSLSSLCTDNMDMIRKGVVGIYNGAKVKISNNLYNDGTDDYMLVRTRNAVAFAGGISKTEAYRPDLQFSDAVKVLDTYGAKVVRQDELYVVKAHAQA